VAIEVGTLVVDTLKADSAHAHAQAALHSDLVTAQFRDQFVDMVQKRLAQVGVILTRYASDPSSPTVEIGSKAFTDGVRAEVLAKLRALGEKP
jgi:hypothetical protein